MFNLKTLLINNQQSNSNLHKEVHFHCADCTKPLNGKHQNYQIEIPAVGGKVMLMVCNISCIKADVYFDQSILNAAFRESETKVDTTIDPGATQTIFDNIIKAELKLEGANKGTTELYIGFKATAEEVCTAADTVAQPGALGTTTAGALGWTSTKKFLNITNPAGVTGSYMIEKV